MLRTGQACDSVNGWAPSSDTARPRVLFLTPVPDFKGGAERSLMDLVGNPAVEPFIVVPAEGPLSRRADELGIEWEVLDFGGISDIRRPFRLVDGLGAAAGLVRVARKTVEIARRRNASLIHSNGLKAHAIALAARRLGGPPAVIHIRDIANTRVERLVWKAFQTLSDRTILVSRACWPRPALPGNAHVVYNGFHVPVGEAGEPRGGPIVLGFVGRIHPAKGLHSLLAGVARARAQGCELELVVRGRFAKETPHYEHEIKQQIGVLGLTGVVRFEGFVADPVRVYERMDAVCVPSAAPDPLPRSVMEAMGRGLVVIASPSGGVLEMIADGETGFLVSDASDFAALVGRLQGDPLLRAEIGRRAREHCLRAFTLERLHREVRQIYAYALRGAT